MSNPTEEIRVLGVTEGRRPDGGIEVRVQVNDAFYRQAQRGLCAHAEALGLDNAPSKRR